MAIGMNKMQRTLFDYALALGTLGFALSAILIYCNVSWQIWVAVYTIYAELAGFIGLSLVEITIFLRTKRPNKLNSLI
jgi:hypothetical protein